MKILFIILFVVAIIVLAYIGYRRFNSSSKPAANAIRSISDHIKENKEKKMLSDVYLKNGPLGLSQGKLVTLGTSLLLKTSAEDAMVPDFLSSYKVGAVGQFSFLGMKFYRFYLGEGDQTFLQFIVDSIGNIQESMILTKVVSSSPDEEGWDYLCGDDGMLGLYEFSLKANSGEDIIYNRQFEPYNGTNRRIEPKSFDEHIVSEDGTVIDTECTGVLYSRTLKDSEEEYLWAQTTRMDDGSMSCDAYVGFIVPDETWLTISS